MPKSKGGFYAVAKGKDGFRGVVNSWNECSQLVIGVPGSRYKKFGTREEANRFAFGSTAGVQGPKVPAKPPAVKQPSSWRQLREGTGYVEKAAGVRESKYIASRKRALKVVSVLPKSSSSSKKLKPGQTESDLPAVPIKNQLSNGRTLTIYTDGACENNGTPRAVAGVGVFFGFNDARNISEPLPGPRQTNQRAEMLAVIRALETLRETKDNPSKVTIKSDSNYTVKGHREWLPRWKRNGWTTSTKKAVKNEDLWRRLDREISLARGSAAVDLVWVKGHAGEPGNEAADRLAVAGIRKRLRC